jgi:hypothetical protein
MEITEREQIVGFRATRDFVRVFDDLTGMFGCSRSELIRYVLKTFTRTHLNNDENRQRVLEEMY